MSAAVPPDVLAALQGGLVIPAMPLALNAHRRLDERHQRALCRYYSDAGAGGLAVGVHTTQFAIRDPKHGLFDPVLSLVAEEFDRADARRDRRLFRVGGVCGRTEQAVTEASRLRELGYHAGLLSLAAFTTDDDATRLRHCQTVARELPIIGFYLQPAVGGPALSYAFWRAFAEIEEVVAIKIAPFNRYQTLDVIRAVVDAGRDDIALYTGNDDNIVADLLTPYRLPRGNGDSWEERRIVGGLLGHWAVGTRRAVELLDACHAAVSRLDGVPHTLLRQAVHVTDANAAFFDVAHGFAGCIAGLHEVLRRQGLLNGIWCLDPRETLSPGQAEEIDRVLRSYPDLNDDLFIAEHRDDWLGPAPGY